MGAPRTRLRCQNANAAQAQNGTGVLGQNGTGTLIVVKSTVEERPGDGLIYAKADGKAAAVALTIVGRPVYLLAAHLPANEKNEERVEFLEEVAEDMIEAMAEHRLSEHGAAWQNAHMMWAGDLNMTLFPLDDETPHVEPSPEAIAALEQLDTVMGGAVDVYRRLFPQGVAYTHGKPQHMNRRRLDTWRVPPVNLQGEHGVVAVRHVTREKLGFSYVHEGRGFEKYKQSDHDGVQIVFRATNFEAPPAAQHMRRATLRTYEMRQWLK